MSKKYIIAILPADCPNKTGYFGPRPFYPVTKEDATVFSSMKAARNQLNRLSRVPVSEVIAP